MEESYRYELRIPKDRVAVLIGKKGEIKQKLEEECLAEIDIDSKEGEIAVEGEDALKLYTLRSIIKAVGRGFNPEVALQLLKPDYLFELINIDDFAKTKNSSVRLKGRIIGKDGKSRSTIEELTETSIVVYGKTVGVIGEATAVSNARRALVNLLSGSTHSSVFKWLERRRAEMKAEQFKDFM